VKPEKHTKPSGFYQVSVMISVAADNYNPLYRIPKNNFFDVKTGEKRHEH
jgi:hypothetical protein